MNRIASGWLFRVWQIYRLALLKLLLVLLVQYVRRLSVINEKNAFDFTNWYFSKKSLFSQTILGGVSRLFQATWLIIDFILGWLDKRFLQNLFDIWKLISKSCWEVFFSPASRLRLSVSACSGIMCTLKDLDSSSSFEEMSQLPSKALDWFHAP